MITKLDIYTPTKVLMQQCGWMPVRQLMIYHSLVLLYKVLKHQSPSYLYHKVTSGSDQYHTRQEAASTAALAAVEVTQQPSVDICELDLSRSSWCWASVNGTGNFLQVFKQKANSISIIRQHSRVG